MRKYQRKKKPLILILVFAMLLCNSVLAAEKNELNGLTSSEYIENKENKKALVNLEKINISFKGKSISCDAFMYYSNLFVPIRNIVEVMNKSIIYDETGNIRIWDIVSESAYEGILFENKEAEAEFNQIPVYYMDKVLAYNDPSYDWICPSGFNCGGYIYDSIADLAEAFGCYWYYDETGNIIIEEPSGRIKRVDNRIASLHYAADDYDYRLEIIPSVDDDLLKEAERMTWSDRTKSGLLIEKCKTSAFTHDGKTYICADILSNNVYIIKGEFSKESSVSTYVYEIL